MAMVIGCQTDLHEGLIGTKGSSILRLFGQLEAAVMQVLWTSGRPAVVRDVLEELQRDRTIAYTTVMTVMDNLFKKGILERELQGRAYRYRPVRTREQHTADLMEEALSTGGDSGATLLHFVEQMPAEDVAHLRELLNRRTSTSNGESR